MKAPQEGALAAAVRSVYEWLTRPRAELDAAADALPGSRPQLKQLTPKGIGDATAALMWAQRGSLKIEMVGSGGETRGNHRLEARHHMVLVPGGLTVSIGETDGQVSIRAPDGQTQNVSGDDAIGITGAWRAVQGVTALEMMGLPIPEQNGSLRPSRILTAISKAVGSMLERSDLPNAQETYEVRMFGDHEEEYSDKWTTRGSSWRDLGSGVFLDLSNGHSSLSYGQSNSVARVMTVTHGVVRIPIAPIAEALERRKRNSFAAALGIAHDLPIHLPAPRGNAQASRVLQLCREAVAAEPNLVDAKGTEIAPLVNRHLPELMRRHAEAAASAPAEQLAAIDAELMEGIEGVRLAVDEALRVSANVKRDALRTQLAFLAARHPHGPEQRVLTAI